MDEGRLEGIVLRAVPYQDHHRIITLFTLEMGMISLLAKRVSNPEKRALLSPFSQIEVMYRKRQSDLYFLNDGSLLHDHLFLREKWDYLETAGKMANLLLHSQMQGKAAPLLYALFSACLKQLPLFEEPSSLLLLFHLKLLTHEGHLSWESPTLFPLSLALYEWNTLKDLATSRSFHSLYQKKGLRPLLEQLQQSLKALF